jgi:hypothetical protein
LEKKNKKFNGVGIILLPPIGKKLISQTGSSRHLGFLKKLFSASSRDLGYPKSKNFSNRTSRFRAITHGVPTPPKILSPPEKSLKT